jgi:hypothetical protein
MPRPVVPFARRPAARGLTALALALLVPACGGDETEPAPTPAETAPGACGIEACAVDEAAFDEDAPYTPERSPGKADAAAIESAVTGAVADGVLSADDVEALFAAAGNRVNEDELDAIRAALAPAADAYTVDEAAPAAARARALVLDLFDDEAETVAAGRTFAEGDLPAAVREVLETARLNGAIAYDVNETDDDGEGVWSPYPATTPPVGNMTFEYTQLTPEALAADLADTTVEYNRIIGTETATTASGQTYTRVVYEPGVGGTGNVLAQYDEAWHPDIYARGTEGQKWANNFAILSDGTIHALPASRRSELQDLILTNPHLSRGRHLLFNGHLDVLRGKVVGVEMSGRLSKRAAEGKARFIDPLALLRAWGFEIADGVTLRYGNTAPRLDEAGHVLREVATP